MEPALWPWPGPITSGLGLSSPERGLDFLDIWWQWYWWASLPGSGTILCPENTARNNHIRPLASVLVECAGWELVPSPALTFCDLENEHQALLMIVVTMKWESTLKMIKWSLIDYEYCHPLTFDLQPKQIKNVHPGHGQRFYISWPPVRFP